MRKKILKMKITENWNNFIRIWHFIFCIFHYFCCAVEIMPSLLLYKNFFRIFYEKWRSKNQLEYSHYNKLKSSITMNSYKSTEWNDYDDLFHFLIFLWNRYEICTCISVAKLIAAVFIGIEVSHLLKKLRHRLLLTITQRNFKNILLFHINVSYNFSYYYLLLWIKYFRYFLL